MCTQPWLRPSPAKKTAPSVSSWMIWAILTSSIEMETGSSLIPMAILTTSTISRLRGSTPSQEKPSLSKLTNKEEGLKSMTTLSQPTEVKMATLDGIQMPLGIRTGSS